MDSFNQIGNMILRRLFFLLFLSSVALAACHTNVTRTGGTPGQINPQTRETNSTPLTLAFSQSSYGTSDTIHSSIYNKTDSDIVIALRCGYYLEMSYQKSVNGRWSENMQLPYMMLKCPTRMHTIKPHEKYECTIPAALFNSTGSFRLLVSCAVATENTNQTITSVPFEIR
jgi:hypothetical protein